MTNLQLIVSWLAAGHEQAYHRQLLQIDLDLTCLMPEEVTMEVLMGKCYALVSR